MSSLFRLLGFRPITLIYRVVFEIIVIKVLKVDYVRYKLHANFFKMYCNFTEKYLENNAFPQNVVQIDVKSVGFLFSM